MLCDLLPTELPVQVYAFGIFLYEIIAHRIPWDKSGHSDVFKAVSSGQRPTLSHLVSGSDHVPQGWIAMMESCWREIPEQRPSFPDLSNMLSATRVHLNILPEESGPEHCPGRTTVSRTNSVHSVRSWLSKTGSRGSRGSIYNQSSQTGSSVSQMYYTGRWRESSGTSAQRRTSRFTNSDRTRSDITTELNEYQLLSATNS